MAAGEVDEFMNKLAHPMKAEVQALRQIILGASPKIAEGIKWNAPSFRVDEYFATFNLRAKSGVQVILHFGAKANAVSKTGVAIDDPVALLEWLAKDRASVKFADMKAIEARGPAFAALLRQWIEHVR